MTDNELSTRYLGTIAALNRRLAPNRTGGALRAAGERARPFRRLHSLMIRIWREPARTMGDRQ